MKDLKYVTARIIGHADERIVNGILFMPIEGLSSVVFMSKLDGGPCYVSNNSGNCLYSDSLMFHETMDGAQIEYKRLLALT